MNIEDLKFQSMAIQKPSIRFIGCGLEVRIKLDGKKAPSAGDKFSFKNDSGTYQGEVVSVTLAEAEAILAVNIDSKLPKTRARKRPTP